MPDKGHPSHSGFAAARTLYRVVTRVEILSAVYILVLCAAFVLETRAHRNVFYALALPVFLANLYALDWSALRNSHLVRLAALYVGYFLLAGFLGDGFEWDEMANLLRVTVLLSLFFAITALLAARSLRLEDQLFFWLSLTGGACLLVLFAAALGGASTPMEWRLTAFGLASHPVVGATLYGFVILVSAFVLLPRAETWPARLLWLAVIALSILFMVLSSSRGPLIALVSALTLGLLVTDRRLALTVLALGGAGVAFALLSEFKAVEMLYTREQSGHFSLWQQALTAIAERPWFGYGSLTDMAFIGNNGPQRSPHNLLLANQIYGGLPGTLLLLALLGGAAWRAWGLLRHGQPIYLILLVFGITASLFDSRSLVQNLGREWITIWLPIALLAGQELRSNGALRKTGG